MIDIRAAIAVEVLHEPTHCCTEIWLVSHVSDPAANLDLRPFRTINFGPHQQDFPALASRITHGAIIGGHGNRTKAEDAFDNSFAANAGDSVASIHIHAKLAFVIDHHVAFKDVPIA